MCLTGTLLPWVGVEGSRRTSYQLASVLDRLDLVDDLLAVTMIRVWPVVPVALVLAASLHLLGLKRSARLVAALAGVVVACGCAVSWSVPLPGGAGSVVAFFGAVVLLIAAVLPTRWLT